MSDIFFQNARGKQIALNSAMTIEHLVRHGVTDIRLFCKDAPLESGWWSEVKKLSGKSPKTDATRNVATK